MDEIQNKPKDVQYTPSSESFQVYLYKYRFPIPNGFRDAAISLYSSKIGDKNETLSTVSNTDIYCSR
jgi:hypothetical protein